ncbi:hypothetical protein WICMUC_002981 [Wickerhamomyces mucosus]|uniref:t-SNARE coiled-coil homology domain-containing protein n=1 Tax=Wickerhamomyces mucosus TaxID=1378264 RepID=A0A9P8PMA8_9ASCO|nr:hypothetical protein WICMUC_002981 [Wickerhamomyces mucosus]
MPDLTDEFTIIAQKIETERGIEKPNDEINPLIPDTFIKESTDLFFHIVELNQFLHNIQPNYLLNDSSKYTSKDQALSQLSEEDKDQIDSESRIELKKYNERFKFLEGYESKRVQSKSYFQFNQSQAAAVDTHRRGILLSLSYELQTVTKFLIKMQETRLVRKRDIEIGSNLNERLSAINIKSAKYTTLPEHEDLHQDLTGNAYTELSQEQLQVLAQENSGILDAKLEDLAKVEKIHKSVLEISALQSELSTQLQLQSESINNLRNEFDITEIDLKEGNKILKKNKKSGNFAAQSVMIVAIVLGLILLLLDWRYY